MMLSVLKDIAPSATVNSMPDKIWILNVDDFVFKANALDALSNHSLKYIQILKQADLCVVSPLIERDDAFVNYMARIKKLVNKDWMLLPAKQSPDETLVQAIMKDKALIARLKKLCKENHALIPLMYTADFAKLSKMCGSNLLNNSIAVQDANNKLVFKKLCKQFDITTIQPVFESGKNKKSKVLSFIDFNETYLLRRPFSAGGYGNTKGKLLDLLRKIKDYHKDGHFYIERFKDIYKTLGSLCVLKDDAITFVGIDSQIVHKEAWEGCSFPFKKIDKDILDEIKEKSMLLAEYYHKKGVRGQVNFDWAVRLKEGKMLLRALECNSRYNGFGLCIRLASTVFNIPKGRLHFYLDTKIPFSPKFDTQKVVDIIENITKSHDLPGGIVLTSGVTNGKAGFCFIATSEQNINKLRNSFKKYILNVK